MIFDALLIYTAICAAVAAAINVSGVSFYDIEAAKHARAKRLHPHRRQLKNRPQVSVIIETQNNRAEITRTLDSLVKTNYRKLQIVIADNASADDTAKTVRGYIKSHPKREILLYAKRKRSASGRAAVEAYRKHANGQIILRLRPGYEADKKAITHAVEYFNTHTGTSAIVPCLRAKPAPTLASIFQSFSLILSNRSRKANDLLNSDYFAELGPAAFYRKDSFPASLRGSSVDTPPILSNGDRVFKLSYAALVAFYVPATPFLRLLSGFVRLQAARLACLARSWRLLVNRQNPQHTVYLIWFRYPLAILFSLAAGLLPVVAGYFIYLAFWLKQPDLLLLGLAVFALVLFFAILEDDGLKLWQKLKLWLLMPVSYVWFALLALAQCFAPFGSLLKDILAFFRRSSESAA